MLALWRHYPWAAGLLLAPLLFGSVDPDGQAIVGFLCALSLLFLAPEMGASPRPCLRAGWRWLALVLLFLPLAPLPAGVVSILSPGRAALAREFPLELGAPASWMPLTVSVAGTVQRLWELALIITAVALARQAGRSAGSHRLLEWTLAGAVALLVASDLWYRAHGRQSILGLWQGSWGYGAGTFANPNHFAHWIYVAVLFLLAGVLRGVAPIQSLRVHPASPGAGERWTAVLLGGVALAGLTTAVASGSRGGLLALLAGGAVWLALLAGRTRSRARWALLAFGSLAAVLVLLEVSDLLFHRLAEFDSRFLARYDKLRIWRETVGLWWRFPLFGVGWGAFAPAFNLFKTRWGGSTCLYAENEYLELLAETGLAGVLVFGGLIFGLARGGLALVRARRLEAPEGVFGAVAALAAVATGALYEFVLQIPANAMLAGALFGWCLGRRDAELGPGVLPPPSAPRAVVNLLLAAALGAVALLQGLAFAHWRQAARARSPAVCVTELRQSLQLWPWAPARQIALTRQLVLMAAVEPESARPSLGQELRADLNRSLATDPFNWELRLERAWLDLAFSTNSARAVAEAKEVVRLNPLQPQIPLRFARHFAARQPETAREFLRLAVHSQPGVLREALAVSWSLDQDTARLWSLTPDDPKALLALGDFAAEQRLELLAAQAWLLLTNRVSTEELGPRFLQVRRPDIVIGLLANRARTPSLDLLLCRAFFQAGRHAEAVAVAGAIAQRHRASDPPRPGGAGSADLATLKGAWAARPADRERARRLADRICADPPAQRDWKLLRQLARQFPRDVRLGWQSFETERACGWADRAAESGLDLATRLVAP